MIGHRPVYEELHDEIVELVGTRAYKTFVALVRERPTEHLLAHPSLKKRP
jgi:ASC-1-like (ASCH) protein